jgi:hypothetical protein
VHGAIRFRVPAPSRLRFRPQRWGLCVHHPGPRYRVLTRLATSRATWARHPPSFDILRSWGFAPLSGPNQLQQLQKFDRTQSRCSHHGIRRENRPGRGGGDDTRTARAASRRLRLGSVGGGIPRLQRQRSGNRSAAAIDLRKPPCRADRRTPPTPPAIASTYSGRAATRTVRSITSITSWSITQHPTVRSPGRRAIRI